MQNFARRFVTSVATSLVVAAGSLAAGLASASATTTITVQQVSTDTLPQYNVNGSSFALGTEVESDTFSHGDTVVSSFQVGRNASGYGAQAVGYSTSIDDGSTWTHGVLPGLTASSPKPLPANYPTVVNQSVAYDAAHGQWIIPTVPYCSWSPSLKKCVPDTSGTRSFHETALLVSRSTDGLSWAAPITAAATNVDKAWGICDNTVSSPKYGTCYITYSQPDSSPVDQFAVVHSNDGGLTWSAPVLVPGATPGSNATGYNTNPVVLPSGRVVLVATDVHNGATGYPLLSSVSDDGGNTWTVPGTLATIQYHTPPGGIRAKNKPTVDIDASGTVYAAWSDCRFHSGCATDDIVYATSTDGITWSAPKRVAADPVTTGTDKFIPGFGVQPGTGGASAHLSAVYYTYSSTACTGTTPITACQVQAQYTTSKNGGATWSAPLAINSTPFPITWLPGASTGGPPMLGDYLSVSFARARAVAVVSLATAAPAGGVYNESEWSLTVRT